MKKIKKDSSLAEKTTGTTSNSMSNDSMSSNPYQGNSRSIVELDVVHEVLEWARNGLSNPTDSLSDGYSLRALSDLVAKRFRDLVEQINMPTDKGGRNFGWVKPNGLSPIQAAEIIFAYEHIRMVCPVETIDKPKSNGVLAFYVRQGKNEGIYQEIGDGQIDKWCVALGGAVKLNWKKEFHKKLSDLASRDGFRVCECEDKSLIFMKNGILNYETKELLEFSPELIALRKSDTYLPMTLPAVPVHTKPDGTSITFWELLKSFAPYEGGVDLLVKTAGAALRSRLNWRGMVTLFNSSGRNGKSTYLDHVKALVGSSGTMTSNLATLAGSNDAGRFGVSNIVGASLITCEDSDSGAYIKDNSRLKSIISHDTISVERKGEPMFDYRPNALILCAANDIPKTKDKGSAWVDRNIFVPFTGQFVGEAEDKSIRESWVVSEEFCSFMAYQALIAYENYYELPEPSEAIELKKEWVRDNDSVVEFFEEIVADYPSFFLPNSITWEAYKEWMPINRPSTALPSKSKFSSRLAELANGEGDWMQPTSAGKGLLINCSKWILGDKIHFYGRYHDVPKDRERGIVRSSMFDYCRANDTTPDELGNSYNEICQKLGLAENEKGD